MLGQKLGRSASYESAVAEALAEGYEGAPSGRVRDVPDERTIRYYTTLGLIDRASLMRGRTAYYDRRHLLQLVAIKKLQAQGQSLAEVQEAIVGQPLAALARLAGLGPGRMMEKEAKAPSSRRSFWKDAPAPVRELGGRELRKREESSPGATAAENDRPQRLQGFQLASNVTLLVAGLRALEDTDLAELRVAAGPLIELLVKLKIISPFEEGALR